MKAGAAVALLVLLCGCAGPAAWDKPGATPEEFMADRAQCELLAEGANPDLGVDTIETGKLGRDIAANAATGFVHGLAQGAAVSHTFSLCMQAKGYIPISHGVLAAIAAARPIGAEGKACVQAAADSPEDRTIAGKDPMNVADLTAAQLSDASFATDEEIRALKALHPKIAACQRKIIAELAASAAAPVAPLFESVYEKNNAQLVLLEDRRITWGQFQTDRKERAEELVQELQTAIITGEPPATEN